MWSLVATLVGALVLIAGGDWVLSLLGRPTAAFAASATGMISAQAWILEALAFVALARLLVGRAGVVLDGLVVGGLVWVLRWPLTMLTMAQLGMGLPGDFATMVRDQLGLDLMVGLTLAWLLRRRGEPAS